ncbi:MAG: GntP family permease [Bacteroidales bacterium]|jgi:GntP family gluconate:H+ symporter|nr:GntP family permease [Bacteroidales bacterium]
METILIFLFSISFIVITSSKFKIHPFLSLILAAFLFGMLSGMPPEEIIENINSGFGGTIGSIGIIIVAGIIIGAFLENSGGAQVLANFVLKMVGAKRVHAVMGIMGWIVSIPVFADSGFVILSSLNRALTKKAGLSIVGTAIALSLGLIISHTLIPPTPGPIAAAGILGADLGRVMLIGICTSIFTLIIAIIFAKYIGKRIYVDPNISENEIQEQTPENNRQPSVIKSFLPILVPIILIILRSIADFPTHPFGETQLKNFISFIGNPVTALFIGIFIALFLPEKFDKKMLSTTGWVGSALKSASTIILITGAGGAFGKVLQTSDIASLFGDNIQGAGLLGLWFPFIIAAAIKTAQGSSTVAMITTASIITPLLSTLGFDTETLKAMAVIIIGAGSSVVSHANDSFFWVVTQMSGINLNQGYWSQTLGCAIVGFSSMIFLTILSLFL